MNLAKRLLVCASLLLACATPLCAQEPTITSPLTVTGYVGVAFSYEITADNAASVNAGSLPAGLSQVSILVPDYITGTPDASAVGTNTVTLVATASQNSTTSTTNLTLVILPATESPNITSSTSGNPVVGQYYTYQILVTNVGVTGYNASPLPSWLSINRNTGLLYGTPLVGNNTAVPTITLSASNGTSVPGTAALNLTIQPASVLLTTNVIFTEGFESNFPAGWQVGDANASAYWATVSSGFAGVTAPQGSRMAYCAGTGYGGSSANPTYQNNMASYMQRTFDLSGSSAATLMFSSLIPGIEAGYDWCNVRVSTNAGASWVNVWHVSRVDAGWTSEMVPLNSYAGKPGVMVRFEFDSDKSITGTGWFLDNIAIRTGQGDRFDNATAINTGTNYTGNVSFKGALDVTTVRLRQGYTYVITALAGTLIDPQMWLFDPNRIQQAYNDDASGLGLGSRITWNCAATGDYFVQVGGVAGGTGSYTLLVTERPVYADILASAVSLTLPDGDPRGLSPTNLSYTLQNNGPMNLDNGETYNYEVDVYLSTNNSARTGAGSGEMIGSETIQLGMASGTSTDVVDEASLASYTIPSDLTAGDYYVWLHVTPLSGSPTDTTLTNNWVVGAQVTLPPPAFVNISGIVTRSGGAAGMSGVALTLLAQDGSSTNVVLTDAYGNYSSPVSNGWYGTITPVATNGAAGGFAPAVRTYTNSVTNNLVSQNFAWTPPPIIAGKVTRAGTSTGVAGVILVLSDGSTTATTDANGNYSVTVSNGWNGWISPSNGLVGIFAPLARAYTNLNAYATGQNFTWGAAPWISGRVIQSGTSTGVPDATITFSGGLGSTNTDSNGNYSFQVPYKWSGTATASFTSGGFATSNITYSALTASKTGKNYTWTPPPVISGKITRSGSSAGVPGATITFSGNLGSANTDSNGNYSFTVPYKWSGTATASFTNGGFATSNLTYSALTANKTGKNYTWTPPPVISGKVTKSGSSTGVTNVTIAFSGSLSSGSTVTGTNGSYSITVPYGWTGMVTPSTTNGGTFSPGTKLYPSRLTANQTLNFSWTKPAASAVPKAAATAGSALAGDEGRRAVGATEEATAAAAAPRQLLHATGMLRWTGEDAARVRRSPELLTVALVNGVVQVQPVVPVNAPGNLTTALEFADNLSGLIGTANSDLIVVRNVNGQPVTDAPLTGTSILDAVLFLTPGTDATLTWDLTLLQP